MCDPVTITVGAMVAAGTMQAVGQVQQGNAKNKMYQYQANLNMQEAALNKQYAQQQEKIIGQVTDANITLAQAESADESRRLARNVAELTGQQTAAMGAMGISGSTAEHIAADTLEKSQLDQMAIRYNANLKSWAYREKEKQDKYTLREETKFKTFKLESEAAQLRVAGKSAKKAGQMAAVGTLLTTAASSAFAYASLAGGAPQATTTTPSARHTANFTAWL